MAPAPGNCGWGREIDGDWHVRPNEIEWDGGSGANSCCGRLDSRSRYTEDPELRKLVQETLAVVDPAQTARSL